MKSDLLNKIWTATRALAIACVVTASGTSYAAGQTQADFPNLPGTAADCLVGRHWDLVPLARCVCDGDPTRTPVSNDNPTACVPSSSNEAQTIACSPPAVGSGTYQTRTLDYLGVPGRLIRTGSWVTVSSDCSTPPVIPPSVCQNGASNFPTCTFPPGGPVITQQTETQTLTCPAPTVGAPVTQTRIVTYSDGVATAYSAWSGGNPVCSGGGAVITYQTDYQTLSCQPPSVGASTQQSRTLTFTNGALSDVGPWSGPTPQCTTPTVPSGPVITTVPENQTLACPAGYSGSGVVQTRQVTYTNGIPSAYGPWTTVASDCNLTPPPITPPADPMVPVAQWICGILYASAVVPQSQVANWYAIMEPAAKAWYGWDGSCGVGL